MSYEPPFSTTPAIGNLSLQVAEMVGSLVPSSELRTSPTLHRKLRIKTIHSSLAVEGNALTENAVSAILDGKRVLGAKKDIIEVQNAERAYQLLPELNPYDIDDLLRVHREMMTGLIPEAGAFRSKNVGVFDGESLIHAGTPASYVAGAVADLFGWLRSADLHPLISSCIFHYEFEFIHPFADGNGRTGRLWHTLLLSHWRPVFLWLPIESVILERQQSYYAALSHSNAAGNSSAFVEFMLEVIKEAMEPYCASDLASASRSDHVLAILSDEPSIKLSELAAKLEVSKRSAERIVAELKNQGRLAREGGPRTGRWVVRAP